MYAIVSEIVTEFVNEKNGYIFDAIAGEPDKIIIIIRI